MRFCESDYSQKTMRAALFASPSTLGFFSAGEPAAGKRSLLNLAEIADVTSPSDPRKALQVAVSGIRRARNQTGGTSRRSSSTKRTTKSNENKKSVQSKSPNQEEVIALLKRIQSSIAKQRHQRTENEETLKDETISDVLCEHSKHEKGKANSNIDGDQVMRSGSATKDLTQQGSVTETEYRPMRLPSKFVQQSPIPFASAPRDGTLGVNKEEHEPQIEDKIKDMKLPVIGKMKLPELKELAKSRGIKGYSKLKKNELLELLQS